MFYLLSGISSIPGSASDDKSTLQTIFFKNKIYSFWETKYLKKIIMHK